jgi:hypothetical protein
MLFTVVDVLLAGAAAISAWRLLKRHSAAKEENTPADEATA